MKMLAVIAFIVAIFGGLNLAGYGTTKTGSTWIGSVLFSSQSH